MLTLHVLFYSLIALGMQKPNEACFYKSKGKSYEPHFDIYSGNELWSCIEGKNNFFCAVALYLYHIKTKSDEKLGKFNCRDLINKLLNNFN